MKMTLKYANVSALSYTSVGQKAVLGERLYRTRRKTAIYKAEEAIYRKRAEENNIDE
jgi:hypothetical protein